MSHQVYETDQSLNEYLLFHYGETEDILPYRFGPRQALNFPARVVSECVNTLDLPHNATALDIGCSVGRTTFELARHCHSVLGIDFSHSFVNAAKHLAEHGNLDFFRRHEGSITLRTVAAVPESINRSRVRFEQGDACALPEDLGPFDVVVAANLICRLPDPRAFLDQLPALLNPGGQLILTTPFSWLESWTPVENWLGGTDELGDSFNGLRKHLSEHFRLNDCFDMPFLIREHVRKYQWSVAQASTWIRI